MDKKYQIEISFGNYKITKYSLSKRKSDLESDKNMTLKLQTDKLHINNIYEDLGNIAKKILEID